MPDCLMCERPATAPKVNSNGACYCPCHTIEDRLRVENEFLREIVAELIRNDGYYGGAPSLSPEAEALLRHFDGGPDA